MRGWFSAAMARASRSNRSLKRSAENLTATNPVASDPMLPADGRLTSKSAGRNPESCHFRIVPVTPSGEQLNGSIFRSDAAYSIVARGNG